MATFYSNAINLVLITVQYSTVQYSIIIYTLHIVVIVLKGGAQVYLFFGLSLGDVVAADFDARAEESFGEFGDRHTEEVARLLSDSVVGKCCLLTVALLLELHVAHEEDGRHHTVDGYKRTA